MFVVAALATVGLGKRLRAGKRDLAVACLIAAPVVGVAVQSYNGEGPYRAYLFALPWLAFLAAFACVSSRSLATGVRMHEGALALATSAVALCLLFAYFGQELVNRIPPDDVAAVTWYEQHAAPGSIQIRLAPTLPDRLTARYPLVSLADPPPLLGDAAFVGHRFAPVDLRHLERVIDQQRDHAAYVTLSETQEAYGRLNGLLPRGYVDDFVRALSRSRLFHLVFRASTAWVFEYLPGGVQHRDARRDPEVRQ
jgi:hypothetical protein